MMTLTTAREIQEQCIVECAPFGRYAKRTRIIVDASTRNVEAFGRLQPEAWHWQRYALATDNGHSSWNHTRDYQHAVDLMRNGWPEGTEKLKHYTRKLLPKLPNARKVKLRTQPHVAPIGGCAINTPAVVCGTPDQFLARVKTREKTRGSKIVRIGINQSASGCTGGDRLIQRGAAVMAVITVLQRLGYSADITVFDAFHTTTSAGRPYAILSEWHVLPAGKPCNPDVVAFAMCHPSTLRRILFAMLEHAPDPGGLRGGYGMVSSMRETFPDVSAKYDIIVDARSGDDPVWHSEESVVAWVYAQLEAQGIKVS